MIAMLRHWPIMFGVVIPIVVVAVVMWSVV